jgi:hypothetical protein
MVSGVHQQPQALPGGPGQGVQQGGQQCSVVGLEPDALVAELALQHSEFVAQCEDLGVLVAIAARQQTQQREHVGDTEVGEAKEHRASSRSYRHRSDR